MHHLLSVCDYTKVLTAHISGSIAPRVMKFGMEMNLHDIWADLEGQGHKMCFRGLCIVFEPTCANARWAHMRHFPSVVTKQKY